MHQQAAPTPAGPSKFVVGAPYDDNSVSDSGSVYVYNIAGTGEQKIVASDGAQDNYFGLSVAMSDTKIVVGAWGDDDAGTDSGSAYVYNTDGTGELKITASDGASSDRFGYSVAISDTHIVVGARGAGGNAGAAYIYNLDGTGEVKIQASDGAANDYFGNSVAMSDTKVVVGAWGDDDAGSSSGSAYVYNTDGTGEVKITASDGDDNDQFGQSVAMSDTKIVVGAHRDDDPSGSGSVYVYNTDGTGEVKITPSDGAADDRFGWRVALSDTKVVVGAPYDDDAGSLSGSVYVYNTDGTGEQKITASDHTASDQFGYSVAVQGDKIIAGAILKVGVGAAYIYNLDGTGEQKIVASDGASGDQFGRSVAVN